MKKYFVSVFDPKASPEFNSIELASASWNWLCADQAAAKEKAETLARNYPLYIVKYGRYTDTVRWRDNDPFVREKIPE